MLLTPAQIKPKSFESRQNSFLSRGGCVSCFRACLGARLLPVLPVFLLESADHVGGQMHGDKECPFRGVTKSGRVWRKVPESDARSVRVHLSTLCVLCVQRQQCVFQKQCVVEKSTRRFCPACRLDKCFLVGMLPQLILGRSLPS